MNIWLVILLVGLGAHLVRAGPLLVPRMSERVPPHLLATLPLVALSCMAATALIGARAIASLWIVGSIAVAMLVGARTNLGLGVIAGWASYAAADLAFN